MERRELEEIERFLTSVGKGSLYVYYGVSPEASADDVEDAIKRRRSWAQGQQSNPKYKGEALFLIKQNALLRRVLLEEAEQYRDHVRDSATHRNLDVLTLFVKGTLHDGLLSPQAEAAIHHQGRQLELSVGVVSARIEEVLREIGATREASKDEIHASAISTDYYTLLEVERDASVADIEVAYRARYRWARSLKDLQRSADALRSLDEAWRIFRDPARRRRYDSLRAGMHELTDEVERRQAGVIGLLGSPGEPPPVTGEVSLSAIRRETVTPMAPPPIRMPAADPPPAPPVRIPTAPHEAATTGPIVPPPATIKGRTLGIADGPQTVRTRGPRLTVEGPEVLSFTVGRQEIQHPLVVRNTGTGRMPGRVSVDCDWLEVVQPKLDPNLETQTVPLRLVPGRMPWGRSAAQVNVVSEHGERRTVGVRVERGSTPLVLAGLAAALFVVAGLAVAGVWAMRQGEPIPSIGASAGDGVEPPVAVP